MKLRDRNVRIRQRNFTGNIEIEVIGPEKWCNKMLKKYWPRLIEIVLKNREGI